MNVLRCRQVFFYNFSSSVSREAKGSKVLELAESAKQLVANLHLAVNYC